MRGTEASNAETAADLSEITSGIAGHDSGSGEDASLVRSAVEGRTPAASPSWGQNVRFADEAQPWWWTTKARTTAMVNLAGIMERSDEQILPALYRYVGASFDASPSALGCITLSRAVVQALASPLGGVAGHYYNRVWVIAFGCGLWGLMTGCFAGTHSVIAGAMFWAVNGIGLSLVIPNCQSLIADYFHPLDRGKAYGALYLTGAVGAMLGTLYATNLGHMRPFDIEGWRFVFLTIGLVSCTIGGLTLLLSQDPRFDPGDRVEFKVEDVDTKPLGEALRAAVGFFKIPTFSIVILQGIVGSTPWNALVFLTLYLQLLGMSDFNASLLYALFLGGTAAGGVIGGWCADVAARRFPNHGRIIVTQFSVGAGVPFSLVLLKALPRNGEPGTVALYAVILTTMGILISWAAPAFNQPAFSELVHTFVTVPASMRNLIFAFDRTFEMALAAIAAPVVGLLAQHVFGFKGSASTSGTAGKDQRNAEALGNALLVCMIVPWLLCFIFYTGLHFTYPRDRQRAAELAEREPLLAGIVEGADL